MKSAVWDCRKHIRERPLVDLPLTLVATLESLPSHIQEKRRTTIIDKNNNGRSMR